MNVIPIKDHMAIGQVACHRCGSSIRPGWGCTESVDGKPKPVCFDCFCEDPEVEPFPVAKVAAIALAAVAIIALAGMGM